MLLINISNQKFYKGSLIKKEKIISMINQNILDGLKIHDKKISCIEDCISDASTDYFIAIDNIIPRSECNEEGLELVLCKVNTSLVDLLEENEIPYSFKKLTIISSLDISDDNYFSTKLVGYEGNADKHCIQTEYTNESFENNSHYVEVLETKLEKEIDITFSRTYKLSIPITTTLKIEKQEESEEDEYSDVESMKETLPSVIINIEEKYENLYRSYSTKYKKDENGDCYGVIIKFKGLKTKKSYPTIKITIIGEPILEETTEG